MRPERGFVVDRVLAHHCPELFRGGGDDAAPPDPLPSWRRAGERLGYALGPALAHVIGGKPPRITVTPPRTCTIAGLGIAALAANCLLAVGTAASPVLVSVGASAVLRLVDRAYGGRGVAPEPLPEAFPVSAELMIPRLENAVAAALAAALDLGANAVRPLRRHSSLARLEPFASATELSMHVVTVSEPGSSDWTLIVATPLDALPALLGDETSRPAAPAAPASPDDAPFADVPLNLRAVIVDMRLPVATLARLAPGTLLPVAVARQVPLKVGERTIAHGAIGALDDRVALQLTDAF